MRGEQNGQGWKGGAGWPQVFQLLDFNVLHTKSIVISEIVSEHSPARYVYGSGLYISSKEPVWFHCGQVF